MTPMSEPSRLCLRPTNIRGFSFGGDERVTAIRRQHQRFRRIKSHGELLSQRRIAPLWDDLTTLGVGDDVFVDTTTANRVMIRWNATSVATGAAEDDCSLLTTRPSYCAVQPPSMNRVWPVM